MRTVPVSVAFSAYQQVAYVEEALVSVLGQDHPDVQVVVYDDGSRDGTADVIRQVVQRDEGPHEVVLDLRPRNEMATGFARIMDRCDGEYVVIAHGDDVSEPDRVSRLVATWQRRGVSLVTSNAVVVDASGVPQRYWRDPAGDHDGSLEQFAHAGLLPAAFGAGLSFERRVWTEFGSLPRGPRQLDLVMCLRGLLLDGAHFDPRPTLRYRQHGGQLSMWSLRQRTDDPAELRAIDERDLQNRLANRVAFVDMVQEHLARHPDDHVARAALPAFVGGLLEAARQFSHYRFDHALAGHGVL